MEGSELSIINPLYYNYHRLDAKYKNKIAPDIVTLAAALDAIDTYLSFMDLGDSMRYKEPIIIDLGIVLDNMQDYNKIVEIYTNAGWIDVSCNIVYTHELSSIEVKLADDDNDPGVPIAMRLEMCAPQNKYMVVTPQICEELSRASQVTAATAFDTFLTMLLYANPSHYVNGIATFTLETRSVMDDTKENHEWISKKFEDMGYHTISLNIIDGKSMKLIITASIDALSPIVFKESEFEAKLRVKYGELVNPYIMKPKCSNE